MPQNNTRFSHFVKRMVHTVNGIIVTLLVLGLTVVSLTIWLFKGCNAQTTTESKVLLSPTRISQIRNIGQWEFLAVSDEELIDTIRHGFFGDDELARIYYGTLRIGIDLREAEDGWIKMDRDTVVVMLPPVKLLDNNFVDEASTKTFYEEGNWSESDKSKLTKKAIRVMKARCLTAYNIGVAEQNAHKQFGDMLRAMGFEHTDIRFKTDEKR